MHLLLIELALIGHHSIYLEKIAVAHLELSRVVTIVVSKKFGTNLAIIRLKQSYGNSLIVVLLAQSECTKAMNSRLGNVGRELRLWLIFQKAFHLVSVERPVDFVFLPFADYFLNAIGLLGSPFGKVAWGGVGVVLRYILSSIIGSTLLILEFHHDYHISLSELFPNESNMLFLCCVGLLVGLGIFNYLDLPKESLIKAGLSLVMCAIAIIPAFLMQPLRKNLSDRFLTAIGFGASK
jgi:hypothetical protein